jgi:2-amino-4-hydroxy-6-hydroxymethyldihydropteridine diphosphokinase
MSSSASAEIELPDWAVVTNRRRAHIARVADLARAWAEVSGLSESETRRWVQAAVLHDSLRDADPAVLRKEVPPEFGDWPNQVLHGPAAAARLRAQGGYDEGVLTAITFHTVGHPDLDDAGRALYLADFLEPGRTFDPISRAAWRARMPHDRDAVLREVVAARLRHMIGSHRPVRLETLAFWNQVTHG